MSKKNDGVIFITSFDDILSSNQVLPDSVNRSQITTIFD